MADTRREPDSTELAGTEPTGTGPTSTATPPLTPKRIVDGAIALADEIGVHALTIRRLADAIDTKPMSIYHHLRNKDAILDAMVDRVFAEIALPPGGLPWTDAMRIRCTSAREVLARHPWAVPLLEGRTEPGADTLAHHDAVLGCLRGGGLTLEMTGHAYAALDAYVYGFAIQEASLPATGGDDLAELAEHLVAPLPADVFPHLTEFTAGRVLQPGYDFRDEFAFGLDLLLDALDRASADRGS